MNNKYMSLKDAVKEAVKVIAEEQFLTDSNGIEWDTFNLMDQDGYECDNDNYYCVGHDGSIGYTRDNGINVDWIYKVC